MIPEVRGRVRYETGYTDKDGNPTTLGIDDGHQRWCPNPYCINTMTYIGNSIANPDVTLLCQKCGTVVNGRRILICKLHEEIRGACT